MAVAKRSSCKRKRDELASASDKCGSGRGTKARIAAADECPTDAICSDNDAQTKALLQALGIQEVPVFNGKAYNMSFKEYSESYIEALALVCKRAMKREISTARPNPRNYVLKCNHSACQFVMKTRQEKQTGDSLVQSVVVYRPHTCTEQDHNGVSLLSEKSLITLLRSEQFDMPWNCLPMCYGERPNIPRIAQRLFEKFGLTFSSEGRRRMLHRAVTRFCTKSSLQRVSPRRQDTLNLDLSRIEVSSQPQSCLLTHYHQKNQLVGTSAPFRRRSPRWNESAQPPRPALESHQQYNAAVLQKPGAEGCESPRASVRQKRALHQRQSNDPMPSRDHLQCDSRSKQKSTVQSGLSVTDGEPKTRTLSPTSVLTVDPKTQLPLHPMPKAVKWDHLLDSPSSSEQEDSDDDCLEEGSDQQERFVAGQERKDGLFTKPGKTLAKDKVHLVDSSSPAKTVHRVWNKRTRAESNWESPMEHESEFRLSTVSMAEKLNSQVLTILRSGRPIPACRDDEKLHFIKLRVVCGSSKFESFLTSEDGDNDHNFGGGVLVREYSRWNYEQVEECPQPSSYFPRTLTRSILFDENLRRYNTLVARDEVEAVRFGADIATALTAIRTKLKALDRRLGWSFQDDCQEALAHRRQGTRVLSSREEQERFVLHKEKEQDEQESQLRQRAPPKKKSLQDTIIKQLVHKPIHIETFVKRTRSQVESPSRHKPRKQLLLFPGVRQIRSEFVLDSGEGPGSARARATALELRQMYHSLVYIKSSFPT